jgi:hypothetical protein
VLSANHGSGREKATSISFIALVPAILTAASLRGRFMGETLGLPRFKKVAAKRTG